MPEINTDVIIVGAAPTGLMLAAELRLAGVRTLVLERLTEPDAVKKAGGLGGQILDLLRHRGLLERFESASGQPRPAPRFPFGGLHVDLTQLADSPMQALLLPQPRMESLLEDIADERGADIRRGHEATGLSQDDEKVTVDVRAPAGPYRLTAQYLVGCDGVHSRVRDMAGIGFPGITYPDVHRFGSFPMPDSVTLLDDGDYEIAGLGRVHAGYTQTPHGIFAISSYTGDDLGLYTSEADDTSYDDETPMTLAEFEASVRRVLGVSIPLSEPTRLTRFIYSARQADRYRAGRIFVAGDAAHQFPSGGVAVNAGMLDSVNLAWKLGAEIGGWAPDGLLDSYHDERHFAGARTLLHTQAQVALRRGLDPAAEALREIVSELFLDGPAQQRIGALISGADLRYPMPGPAPHVLAGTFASDLDLHDARPVFLDLADRADLREIVGHWRHRVDVRTARPDGRPADALLIRPDAYIAWGATVDEPPDVAAPALREALTHWFGAGDGSCRSTDAHGPPTRRRDHQT
jgi:2-polyprenyl-6-methoxyphenol hydroxylase-like FAD-dependent oxidoreductase